MAEFGAFAFGAVLGWFTYFTNRYRKGDVQFSDITSFVGIVGGGAVTALFGDARTALFGAYGIGLAVGFFAYFVVLLWMVGHSGGAFGWTWFLDGRRKRVADDETADGADETARPMAMRPPQGMEESAAAASAAQIVGAAPVEEAMSLRDQAIEDTFQALRDLARRIAATEDGGERGQLRSLQDELTERQNLLLAVRLKEVRESDSVREALAQLRATTAQLSEAAGEMRSATDALTAATRVMDRVARLTRLLGLFA